MWGEKYVQHLLVFLVAFLSLIFLIFKSHGLLFKLEFVALLVLFLIAAIILLSLFVEERFGFTAAFFFYAVFIINLLFLKYHLSGQWLLFGVSLLAALIGFLLSVMSLGKKVVPLETYHEEVKIEPYGGKKTGKYVASSTGTTYHLQTCDWAKKIIKKNQVFFDSASEAEQNGFKKHSCLS